ncbi:heme-binding beta-barrel domain-containing protein [Glutamicibacter bergerei]|uniref:Peroxynitrite isomerase n=1 Tax=Glutamicibacter bergerei TaxID=256702 RepID=A0ABV9MNV3_9MICC|nr:FABP family protein [Micrococcaceae bacterium]
MAFDIPTDLTPELVPFAWLIGSWEGTGRLGEGEESDPHFWQHVAFRDVGAPYLEYRSEAWLTDVDGTKLRILSVENGFWALERQQQDADAGPGMTPGDIFPALRSADDVQKLHTKEGFKIQAHIVQPGGISELYYGLIDGPRIQLATEALLRSKNAKQYASSTRMYGLVNGNLFWRWDVSLGNNDLKAHASAALKRVTAEAMES